MLRDEEPTHIGVAFDLSRQTFRLEEYAEYKAGRSATPTEFSGQIPLVHEVLDALKIRYIEAPGYEADDIIATLTTQATAEGMEVVIVSGDRDVFQLVADDVTMVYPVRGVSDVWRMDPAAVKERYLVPPERYSDLAALVGESSDNLPGVPGVGPKTAAKWITTYGDLPGIVANIDKIGGKVGDALREHLDGGAAQPPAQPAGPRRVAGRDRRRARTPDLGPRTGARGVRQPGVPGPAGAAVPDPRRGHRRGRVRLRRRRRRAVLGRGRRLARPARPRRGAHQHQRRRPVGPGHRRRARAGRRHRRRARRIPRRHPARRAGRPGRRRLAGRPDAAQGCCTTPRDRRTPSPRAAGTWPA